MKTRDGVITFDSRDTVIGPALYWQGGWERDLMRATKTAMRAHGLADHLGRTLVDVGANIGTTTVAFLRERAFDRAVAIEPEPANFGLLERNVRQNGLTDRVTCRRVALGEAAGVARLALSPTNLGDHRIDATSAPGAFGEEAWKAAEVPMERLDDVVARDVPGGRADVGLIWMDVQGYEGHVLAGAPGLLASGVPVELELWPYGLARAGTAPDALLGLLAASFGRFIDLRDPSLSARPVSEAARLYETLSGPDDSTELLLFR